MNEDGTLSALEGETEFPHIPDWFEWERQQVRQQIEQGAYSFTDEVDVYSFPRCWRFIPLGKATVTHDPENGFVLEGEYRGKPYRVQRPSAGLNSLHVEYAFNHCKPFDCFDISTEKDSFYCYPSKKDVITKLGLATEEMYKIEAAKKQKVTV